MNTRTQAVLVDCTLAVTAVTGGVLGDGTGSVVAVAVAALGAGALVVVLALGERGRLLGTYTRHRPLSSLLVFAAGVGFWLVVLAGQTVTTAPHASLLVGTGFGLLGYRLVYGVVWPLPDRRHQQATLVREATLGGERPDQPE